MAGQFIRTPSGWKYIDNPNAPWDVSRQIGQPVNAAPALSLPSASAATLPPQNPQTPLGNAMRRVDVNVPPVNEVDITGGQQSPQVPQMPQEIPQVPQGILNAPSGPTEAPKGMLASIPDRKDANSIYDALLQGGAAMIGGRNGRESLSKGLAMFGTEYDRSQKDALAEQKANMPKVTPLADGAFSLVVDPTTGKQSIMSNKEVQDYIQQLESTKMANALAKLGYGNALQAGREATKAENKNAAEYRPMLNSVDSMIEAYTRADGIVSKQGKGAQLSGAFPGIAGALGSDEAANNKILQGMVVDETLLNTAKTKGAISDKEMLLFKSPLPTLTDHRQEVWKPFIAERLPVLKKLKQYYESEVARGATPAAAPPGVPSATPQPTQPATQPAPTTPSQAPNLTVPGLSPRATKYFS